MENLHKVLQQEDELHPRMIICNPNEFDVTALAMPKADDLTKAIELAKAVEQREAGYYLVASDKAEKHKDWKKPVLTKVDIPDPFSWKALGENIVLERMTSTHTKGRMQFSALITPFEGKWIDILSPGEDDKGPQGAFVLNIIAITKKVREIVEGCVGRSTS
eukprot:GHVU01157090.1.p1 GENE.GHVU01157090.1~~GHVU01157090.1.p1  ORF type:complete len:162 (-),score=29.55 GHVU01157090.1:50-535(-)